MKEKKTAYIIARIGLIVVGFVFAFAYFGNVTGKGTLYFFEETLKVIQSIIGIK